MIKVHIIALGKLKESYLREAVAEYSKRLSRYCTLKITELEPEKLSDNPSDGEIKAALKKEAGKIKSHFPNRCFKIAMCIEGKMCSSEKLAELMDKRTADGADILFIIGSSYGLDEDLKKNCDMRLSMSEMTFPHQLARVMLCEQIYRAIKINEGSKYHK